MRKEIGGRSRLAVYVDVQGMVEGVVEGAYGNGRFSTKRYAK